TNLCVLWNLTFKSGIDVNPQKKKKKKISKTRGNLVHTEPNKVLTMSKEDEVLIEKVGLLYFFSIFDGHDENFSEAMAKTWKEGDVW
ncbi:hypothetical protein KI387_017077, partial [Taxus chinensis]